jgi:hypothetical protein
MKQSTQFIVGSVVFILLFSVFAIKLQDNSLLLNAKTLHEKLVLTTNDYKGVSLVNHLLFNFNVLSLQDKIIGSIALLGGFWYLRF